MFFRYLCTSLRISLIKIPKSSLNCKAKFAILHVVKHIEKDRRMRTTDWCSLIVQSKVTNLNGSLKERFLYRCFTFNSRFFHLVNCNKNELVMKASQLTTCTGLITCWVVSFWLVNLVKVYYTDKAPKDQI
jgi:hypothetical protein